MDWGKTIADLHEARRYAWSDPMECRRQVWAIMERMRKRAEDIPSPDGRELAAIGRMVQNLAVGSFFAVVSATTFAGYIGNTAFELEARTWAIKAIGGEVPANA